MFGGDYSQVPRPPQRNRKPRAIAWLAARRRCTRRGAWETTVRTSRHEAIPGPHRARFAALFALLSALVFAASACDDCGGASPSRTADAGPPPSITPHASNANTDAAADTDTDAAAAAAAAADLGPLADAPPRGLRGGGSFFEVPDGDLRERLASQPLREVKRGYGGRSVAFKITLADGTQGYYKPEQTFSAAHWWAEVAAYHLDRALGLHRTPPVVSRRLPWAELRAAAPSDERFAEVIVGDDGTVRGCFSYWVPDRLTSMRFGRGWERWVRVQSWPDAAVSPFQRPRVYMELLAAQRAAGRDVDGGSDHSAASEHSAAGDPAETIASDVAANERNDEGTQLPHAPVEPDDAERAAELSDLLVFDYLTQNTDRWGGGNANVLTRGAGGRIVFLDNAAGFPNTAAATTALMDSRLRVLQRFRRRTVAALRALDVQQLARRMESEPLAPILDARQLAHVGERRNTLLARVAEMEQRFGDEAYFP